MVFTILQEEENGILRGPHTLGVANTDYIQCGLNHT